MQTNTTISKLRASSANVRSVADPKQHEFLKASILSIGLIHPITVSSTADGMFEVIAGQRRTAAIRDLIAAGELDEDYAIKIDLLETGASAVEVSLAENIQREAMSVADEVTAFKRLVDEQGLTADEIASRFGYTEATVQQRLALASLYPPIIDGLRRGDVSLAVAKAFTLSPDHERQREVFERHSRLVPNPHIPEDLLDEEAMDEWDYFEGAEEEPTEEEMADYNAYLEKLEASNKERAAKRAELGLEDVYRFEGRDWDVKRALSDDAVRGNSALALLVGAEAFIEAGGTVTTDLFPDREDAQLFSPESLLSDLATAQLNVEAERIREAEGWRFVTALAQSYIPYEFALYRTSAPGEGEDNSEVGRVLLLAQDGTMKLDSGYWTDVKPRGASSSGSATKISGPTNALSAKALNEIAYMRREILQVELMRHPDVAHAYAIFSLVDKLRGDSMSSYGTDRGNTIGTGDSFYRDGLGYGSETPPYRQQPTAEVFGQLYAGLDDSWIGEAKSNDKNADLWARFERFLALSAEKRIAWAGWAVTQTLKTSAKAIGERCIPFHDALGDMLGIDVRSHFTPGVENYFTYLTGGQILALLEPFPDTKAAAAKMKAAERKAFMAELCSPNELTKGDHPEAAAFFATWTPPEVRFADEPKAEKKAKAAKKPKAEKKAAKPKESAKKAAKVAEPA
jgi:ParB family transcriptional regulator, chromosome partitioning protein